jgi:hypothetical protein
LDRHTCADRYSNPDLYAYADIHQYAAAEPDLPSDRYSLGHLDTQPNTDRYVDPESHPGSQGDLYFSPNLDT